MSHYDCKGCNQRDCICIREMEKPREIVKCNGWQINGDYKLIKTGYEYFKDEPNILYYNDKPYLGTLSLLRMVKHPIFKTKQEAKQALIEACKKQIKKLIEIIDNTKL